MSHRLSCLKVKMEDPLAPAPPHSSGVGVPLLSPFSEDDEPPQPEFQTPPSALFSLFTLINLLTLADRAIIPGASKEFAAFSASASDSPRFVQENSDAGLGLLQAAFVGGYSIASLISSHLVHKIQWKILVGAGLVIWIVAVAVSGFSRTADSFFMLLFSRMATGVSEAAFHVVAPPMIQDRGGLRAGLWLSLYLTALPIGLAIGYSFGSIIAHNPGFGWEYAFYIECLVAIPLLVLFALVRDDKNGGVLSSQVDSERSSLPMKDSESALRSRENASSCIDDEQAESHFSPELKEESTVWTEIKACLSSKVFVCITLGNAALIAVVATLGTFGGAFILALQLFDSEQAAAITFGVAAALAGIIGTPLGGHFVDRILGRHEPDASSMEVLTSILPAITLAVVIGAVLCWPICLMKSPISFLSFLFLGWIFLFMSQSGMTIATMLSVDKRHRPNAIALMTLMTHIFGDVPAPIFFGALKDYMAPACTINGKGQYTDLKKCQEQHWGLRATLAIAISWTTWTLVFFEMARWFAKREVAKERRIQMEEEIAGAVDSLDIVNSTSDSGGILPRVQRVVSNEIT